MTACCAPFAARARAASAAKPLIIKIEQVRNAGRTKIDCEVIVVGLHTEIADMTQRLCHAACIIRGIGEGVTFLDVLSVSDHQCDPPFDGGHWARRRPTLI